MLQIALPDLIFDQDILINGFNDTLVQKYTAYMLWFIKGFIDDNAKLNDTLLIEAKEIMHFFIELAKIMPLKEEQSDWEKQYNPMKFVDLHKKFPSIPFKDMIKNTFNPIPIQPDEVIIVHYPKFLSDLEILLSKTPKRYEHTQMSRLHCILAVCISKY